MWHAQAGFIFCLFLLNVLLYFPNVLYLHFVRFMRRLYVNGKSVWQNFGKSKLFTGLNENKLYYAVFI
jgi:hypothetical protein